ncbi:MAG TPA: N-acetylneuraminate synthase family protein, partial [Aggregatilineales bacterium]|nr:N-acetylneuraminate synthase family protein [Aggregatilineales bacterium]
IGDGAPTFIIAEAGSNWRMGTPARDMAMGRALIDVAVEAGADAVKFQTYRSHTVYVKNAGESDYLAEAGIKQDIISIFDDLSMPYEMVGELAADCESKNILFMSSPFSIDDFNAVDPYTIFHKIASYEISHIRLLEAAAKSGKPLVLSTGASNHADIRYAVDYFYDCGGKDLVLMQCTAKYPAPLDTLALRVLPELRSTYGVPVGLSDHSEDPVIGPAGAVALGASVIEKHYTLDKRLPGPDHAFAVTPEGLKQLVRAVRDMEQALGTSEKDVQPAEEELYLFARRSVQATKAILKGETLQEGVNIDILRPGKQKPGLHPKYLSEIEGKKATRDIS